MAVLVLRFGGDCVWSRWTPSHHRGFRTIPIKISLGQTERLKNSIWTIERSERPVLLLCVSFHGQVGLVRFNYIYGSVSQVLDFRVATENKPLEQVTVILSMLLSPPE